MSPGATFERVYRALKQQLGDGRFRPGAHLEPRVLSDDLNASITPVRDALHRLVGEGLVEAPHGDGFRTPAVSEVGLRHLYAWNGKLLRLAVRGDGAPAVRDVRPPSDRAALSPTERLFLDIAARSGNPEHVEAVLRLNDRLRPVRNAEARLGIDIELELTGIEMASGLDDPAQLRRCLAAYHRQRLRLTPQIVVTLQGSR